MACWFLETIDFNVDPTVLRNNSIPSISIHCDTQTPVPKSLSFCSRYSVYHSYKQCDLVYCAPWCSG